LFRQDTALSDYYNHKLAGGKWDHMMDQTHIGYSGWQQPESNSMPRVVEVMNSSLREPQGDQPDPIHRKSETRDPDRQRHQVLPTSAGAPEGWRGFVESDGCVSMEAEHFTRKRDTAAARWEVLPDHGRTLSAMTVFPVTARGVSPPEESPCLEYQMWLTSTGAVEITAILSPCLNFAPNRGVHMAVSCDDEPPQMVTVVPKDYRAGDGNQDWEETVKDSARKVKTTHRIANPGSHTLKVWMADPAIAVQKIVVDLGGVKPSFLGPPESLRR
jgi:hypothetical protein